MDELNPQLGTNEETVPQGDVQNVLQDLPSVNQEEQGQEDFSLPEHQMTEQRSSLINYFKVTKS